MFLANIFFLFLPQLSSETHSEGFGENYPGISDIEASWYSAGFYPQNCIMIPLLFAEKNDFLILLCFELEFNYRYNEDENKNASSFQLKKLYHVFVKRNGNRFPYRTIPLRDTIFNFIYEGFEPEKTFEEEEYLFLVLNIENLHDKFKPISLDFVNFESNFKDNFIKRVMLKISYNDTYSSDDYTIDLDYIKMIFSFIISTNESLNSQEFTYHLKINKKSGYESLDDKVERFYEEDFVEKLFDYLKTFENDSNNKELINRVRFPVLSELDTIKNYLKSGLGTEIPTNFLDKKRFIHNITNSKPFSFFDEINYTMIENEETSNETNDNDSNEKEKGNVGEENKLYDGKGQSGNEVKNENKGSLIRGVLLFLFALSMLALLLMGGYVLFLKRSQPKL